MGCPVLNLGTFPSPLPAFPPFFHRARRTGGRRLHPPTSLPQPALPPALPRRRSRRHECVPSHKEGAGARGEGRAGSPFPLHSSFICPREEKGQRGCARARRPRAPTAWPCAGPLTLAPARLFFVSVPRYLSGEALPPPPPPRPPSPSPALPAEVFKTTDQAYLASDIGYGRDDGSTATVACIIGRVGAGRLVVANVGDSRAVLCRDGRAVALSIDHKPNRSDERQRIENAGGVVVWAGTWRVGGVLAVSRAFGDRLLKGGWRIIGRRSPPPPSPFVFVFSPWPFQPGAVISKTCRGRLHERNGGPKVKPRSHCRSTAQHFRQMSPPHSLYTRCRHNPCSSQASGLIFIICDRLICCPACSLSCCSSAT